MVHYRSICLFVLHQAEALGISSAELYSQSGVDASFCRNATSGELVAKTPSALATLTRISPRHDLGLQIGSRFHLGVFGLAGVTASYALNLPGTVKTLSRFSRIPFPYIEPTIQQTKRLFHWQLDVFDPLSAAAAETLVDGWAAAIVAIGRHQLGGRFVPKQISMQRKVPHDPSPYEDHFKCPIQFGSRFNRVTLDEDVVVQPTPFHDKDQEQALLVTAGALHRPDAEPNNMRSMVADAIHGRRYELSKVSSNLGLQPRTVQRRLQDQNTSFQEVLDDVRKEVAEQYLQIPWLTVAQIARRLGYGSSRSFRAAYRRWTGKNPREEQGPTD
jgi:AraC-like DNA-binding protein